MKEINKKWDKHCEKQAEVVSQAFQSDSVPKVILKKKNEKSPNKNLFILFLFLKKKRKLETFKI